jgi:S1-C subfamily serine protease
VIGVNTKIATGSSAEVGNVGIGFAVPINTVRDVVDQLERRGRVDHAELGVDVQELNQEIADLFRLPTGSGLLVTSVKDGSGAQKAGIKTGKTPVVVAGESWLPGGDILVKAGGAKLATSDDLQRVVAAAKPGQRMKVELFRGDQKKTVTVVLSRRS